MADKNITKLTKVTNPSIDDLMLVVDNPTDAPSNRKVTIQNLAKLGAD